MLKQPKDLELEGKTYVIHKFPATVGREIISQYPLTGAPVIGNYKSNEALMLKLMTYVGVRLEGRPEPQMLNSQLLIDNHIDSWETLMLLEKEMMVYNCAFFTNGRASTFFEGIVRKVLQWLIETLIPSLAHLSNMEKPPSTN